MVIRRIREHVAAHNWFAVAIDLAIVIVGVVLGTQVNNWNQERIEQAQGEGYRERLIADLRANEADLLDRKSYYGNDRCNLQFRPALSRTHPTADAKCRPAGHSHPMLRAA